MLSITRRGRTNSLQETTAWAVARVEGQGAKCLCTETESLPRVEPYPREVLSEYAGKRHRRGLGSERERAPSGGRGAEMLPRLLGKRRRYLLGQSLKG